MDTPLVKQWDYRCKDCGYIGPPSFISKSKAIGQQLRWAIGGMITLNYVLRDESKAPQSMLCCSKCKSQNVEETIPPESASSSLD